jgi:hypothetical protein
MRVQIPPDPSLGVPILKFQPSVLITYRIHPLKPAYFVCYMTVF